MKCPNCGKEIANDSQFCEYCGVKLQEKNNKIRWIILIVILGIGGVLYSLSNVGNKYEVAGEVPVEESYAEPSISSSVQGESGASKIEHQSQAYIDLGLPSGTLWKTENEDGYYTGKQAATAFGHNMPSYSQLKEIHELCRWVWQGNGYRVIGLNGNSIFLPALGYWYLYTEPHGSIIHTDVVGAYISYDGGELYFYYENANKFDRWLSSAYEKHAYTVRLVR